MEDAADVDPDDAGTRGKGRTAEPPGRPGVANVVQALNVQRNAAIGFAVGIAFTLFVVYVYVIIPDRSYSLGLWLTLGFVLAVGTGMLLTAVLTLGSALRKARELE